MKNLPKSIGTFFGVSAVLALVLFLSCKLTTNYPAYAKNDPPVKTSPQDVSDLDPDKKAVADTVNSFFESVNKGPCEKASALRDGYDVDRCQKVKKITKLNYTVEDVFDGYAVVHLDVSLENKDQSTYSWKGYFLLRGKGNQWTIMDDGKGYWIAENHDTLKWYTGTTYQKCLEYFRDKTGIKLVKKKSSNSLPFQSIIAEEEKKSLATWNDEDVAPQISEKKAYHFGSNKILGNCWSSLELGGTDKDRKVLHGKNVYNAADKADPPIRRVPSQAGRLNAVQENRRGSIRRVDVPGDKKFIALTFDLCERQNERTGYDRDVINYLRMHRVKATFYAGGKWMRSHPEKAKQLMADPLFEIGNHAWTHGNFGVIDEATMRKQILWTQAQYEVLWDELAQDECVAEVGKEQMDNIPRVPLTFRFPYGTCKPPALELLANFGLPAIQWDVVSGDPDRKQLAEPMAQGILRHTKSGSIIICHANGRGHHTREALPLFIPQLRDKGYQFVTVSELLDLGQAETHDICYELKPGDNERYNEIFGEGME